MVAQRLSYHIKTHHVLLPTYIGRRKHQSTKHALHAVTAKIYKQWNNRKDGQVASLLLLDISGAFNNISYKRLLYNLQKQKVNKTIVRWIASFLSDRHTHILVNRFKSEDYAINTGIS